MRVDDMSGETLEYWADKAAVALAKRRRHNTLDEKVCRIHFEDDAPDPLNNLADAAAIIFGLYINLTCDYDPYGGLIVPFNAWTARCGWPGLTGIEIRGNTQQEAVTRLFVAMVIGREV